MVEQIFKHLKCYLNLIYNYFEEIESSNNEVESGGQQSSPACCKKRVFISSVLNVSMSIWAKFTSKWLEYLEEGGVTKLVEDTTNELSKILLGMEWQPPEPSSLFTIIQLFLIK